MLQVSVLEESWIVYRRYRKFREFHEDLKDKFPEVRKIYFAAKLTGHPTVHIYTCIYSMSVGPLSQIGALVFPPKKWFGNLSDRVASERRILLEVFISLSICYYFKTS